jgi:drug/metabolite transporter (DMT)-like permease
LSGATYLILAGLGLALVNSVVKLIPHIPPYEILFFRAVVSLALTFAALRAAHISPLGKNRPMLLLRGLAGTFGLLLYFYTLQSMPFATAVTVQYLHPILTGVVAGYLLKEHPSKIQWLLLGLSFAGVLMVRGFDPRVSAGALAVGVVSACLTSLSFTLIRALRHEDHAMVVMFYLPLVSLVVLGPYAMIHWVPPTGFEWWVLIAIGALTQISQYFLTRAYQLDTAANITNLNYLGIIYALIIGAAFFNERILPLSLAGMALIAVTSILSARFRQASV